MVAGAQQQPQLQHQSQPQQHQNPQKQQLPLTSAEEEALKRNTDCVYFLASPLTCKKGSECEYRHSEYARVNPRDCWYWLNGNCLNPKCTFRHPPLDGLLGAQATTPTGASLSSSQPPAAAGAAAAAAAAVSVTHVPFSSGSGKQAVPCIFFQKGLCLKGDRCAFLHGPNPPTGSKAPQAPASTLGSETSSLKKPFGGLQKCAQEKKILQPNVSNSVAVPLQGNTALKVETSFPRNGASIERNAPSTKAFNDETFRPKTISNVTNGIFTSRSSRAHQVNVSDDHSFQNGKDADEFLRESSPGFDVLVDDELRDSDYFPGEDQYGRARGLDGRNVNSLDEYDMDQSGDYSLAADLDNDRYRDPRGYDSLDHMQGQYAWDQHRASSERVVVEPPHLDRRGYRKSNNSDHIDESDLRYRLSKHRRVNGLRSVISHEYGHDDHVDGRGYKGSSRRDSHQITPRDASASSRLRGRIKLPGRTSPVNDSDMRPEREHDRGRVPRGRLSPSRTEISTRQGRLRDRIKARVHEDYNKEGGNFRGPHTSREIMEDNNASFAAPKRLSELKVGKFAENKEQSQLGRRKSSRMDTNQQSEGDLSFEGPKPLSEILKRKRGADAASSGSGKSSINKEENNQQSQATQGEEEGNSQVSSNKEEFKSATADIVQTEEKTKTCQEPNANDLDAEDGMIYDETVEDQELEGEYQRDGEYDYEQGEEGEYYEGENAEGEEEYYEEEEEGEDDFAKKIGVELS